jgi:hypothetical protein
MLAIRFARAIVLVVALGTTTASSAASRSDFAESMSADGLEEVWVKNIDLVYARPGLTLVPYAKVMIAPVRVAF